MRWNLINGEVSAFYHPETFEIPTTEEISKLKVGDFVKVGVTFRPSIFHFGMVWDAERFWVEILKIQDGVYQGHILNRLVGEEAHGLYMGRRLTFKAYNILAV